MTAAPRWPRRDGRPRELAANLKKESPFVGLDPRGDIRWLTLPASESKERLGQGQVDAFMGFPPDRASRLMEDSERTPRYDLKRE